MEPTIKRSLWVSFGLAVMASVAAYFLAFFLFTIAHGSGCIFASAIAASLAREKTLRESVAAAKDFITAAIRTGLAIGKGYGPANPMALLYQKAGVAR